ncbi:MAG: lactate utilization protein [Desulfosudaceae bacterium]
MENPLADYWKVKLEETSQALKKNNFETHMVDSAEAAARLALEKIIPPLSPQSVSWGGSLTFTNSGLYESLRDRTDLTVLDTFDKSLPREESLERRRQALLTDLFVTGTNAITASGKLVNLDMIGNRVAALAYGPKHVLILAGRNKIVPDVDAAVTRIKDYAAPVNTRRLDKKTPCVKTAACQDCSSPDRICNTWVITEKSFPPGRLKIILINQDLGF